MQNNDVYDLYANSKFCHQQDQYYVTNLVTQTSYKYVKANTNGYMFDSSFED